MSGTVYEEKNDWWEGIKDISIKSDLTGDVDQMRTDAQNATQEKEELEEAYDNLFNEKFEYDATYDPLFQQYAAQYMQKGNMAMKNAMAESALLTGGYGNSWAMSAGAQAFNSQMDALYGLIPELRAAAYDEWATDKKTKLQALSDDLDEAGELADTANADYNAAFADHHADIIDYIVQGIMDSEITENEIPMVLSLYDNEFTEEEINALTADILETVEFYALKEAEQNGIIANIKADIVKNPEHNTEAYITAELAKNGLDYEDIKGAFGIDESYEFYDGKTPTQKMFDEALAAYETGDEEYLKYLDTVSGYSQRMLDEHINKYSNRFKLQETQNQDYYIAKEDDDTNGWLWGIDRKDLLSYKDTNDNIKTIKVSDLMKELIALGMTKKDAKQWINKNIPKNYEGEQ